MLRYSTDQRVVNSSEHTMAKAYWISFYREVSDPAKLAAYGKIGTAAIEGGGGRFIARGVAAQVYEAGIKDRTVVIEFDSVDAAIATYNSAAYQEALKALDGGAVREIRIVAGV
jgi:uncharacterized protein (DUF1330 family)